MGLSCSQQKSSPCNNTITNKNENLQQSDHPIALISEENELKFEIQISQPKDIGNSFEIQMNLQFQVKEEIAHKVKRPGVDISILLDVSNSMEGIKLENSKKAILGLLRTLDKMDRISIILFRGKAKIHLQWTANIPENQDLLIKSILAIQTPQKEQQNVRNIEEAVELSLEILDQCVNSQTLFVLISDGSEYMNIDIEKLQRLILGCESPKQYAFYCFSFDLLFIKDDQISQFTEFTNGQTVPVTDIENFEILFVFKIQQILTLYSNEVKIVLQSHPLTKLVIEFQPKDKQLRFNDQKYELRLKYINAGINYNIPFKLVLQSKDSLNQIINSSANFIQASIFGEISFRTKQVDQCISIQNLNQNQNNQIVIGNYLKQEVLFNSYESYQQFQQQQITSCLQRIEQIVDFIRQNCNMQDTQIVFLHNKLDQIIQIGKQLSPNLELVDNYPKIIQINQNFKIMENLLYVQQDLNNQESLSLSQSQLLNQLKVVIRKVIIEKCEFYEGKVENEYAEDLNDEEPDNFLFKPSNF